MAKMLHIVGDSKFGGDSVLVVALSEAAREVGITADILTTDDRFQDAVRAANLGLVDLDVIRRPIRPLWDYRGLRRLTRFLADSGYDLVHTHTSKGGFVGRWAAARAGIPAVVHTVHGFAFHEESSPTAVRVYTTMERRAATWCDRIVTVSEFHRRWALEAQIAPGRKLVAIPNGLPPRRVETGRDVSEVRGELGLESGELMVLSTGRLAEQKGIEYLIRAVDLVPSEPVRFKVFLAGDGPLRADLEKLGASLGVSDRITFLGFRDDIGSLLAAADLVVLPSLWEGMSISLLEAMAAQRPVITTSIGSNLEVTDKGEGALLVPPKDPVRLAEVMQLAMADAGLRTRVSARGAEIQRSRYREDIMLAKYMDLYDDLLTEKGHA